MNPRWARISNEDYHKGPGVSSSQLKGATAANIKANLDKEYEPPTAEMIKGTHVHDILHDGAALTVPPKQVLSKSGSRAGNAYREWLEDVRDSSRVVGQNDYDQIMGMVASVRSHTQASEIYQESILEMSGYLDSKDFGLVKIRPDCKRGRMMADLKTSVDASPSGFQKAIANFDYHASAAFYMDIGAILDGSDYTEWHWIVVEKKKPYLVAVYQPDEDMLEAGREKYLRGLEWIKEGRKTGEWPGYESQTLSLPRWAA